VPKSCDNLTIISTRAPMRCNC